MAALQLQPTRGDSLEVTVAWHDRILSTHYFDKPGEVSIGGGDDTDIFVPTLSHQTQYRLSGEVLQRWGEVARMDLPGGLISLYIRHTERAPKQKMPALIDFSSLEILGMLMAAGLVFLMYLSFSQFQNLAPEESREEHTKTRKATIHFSAPARHLVEEIAQAPSSSPPAGPVHRSKPAAQRVKVQTSGGLLAALNSRGLRDKIAKSLGDGDLGNMPGIGTRASRPQDSSSAQLRETPSGREGQTVGASPIGTFGRKAGDTGYSRTGGLGPKGALHISVDTQGGTISGGMDREAIRRVIRDNFAQIRHCYEKELQHSPNLYGKLVLEWDIEEGGRVTRTAIKSDSLGNAQVGECLASHLRTWKFPDPPMGVVGRVTFPFIFSSQ